MSGTAPSPEPPSDPNEPTGHTGGMGTNDPLSYPGPQSGTGGTGPTGTPAPAGPDDYQPDPSEVGANPTSGSDRGGSAGTRFWDWLRGRRR